MAAPHDIFQFKNGKFMVKTSGGQCHPRASIDDLKDLFYSQWCESQLLHYGLPPSTNKGEAVLRLLDELNRGMLKVPQNILDLEQKLARERNNEHMNKVSPTTPLRFPNFPQPEPATLAGRSNRSQVSLNDLSSVFNSVSLKDYGVTNKRREDTFIFGNYVVHDQPPPPTRSPQAAPVQTNQTLPNTSSNQMPTSSQQPSLIQANETGSTPSSGQTPIAGQQPSSVQTKQTSSNTSCDQTRIPSQQPSAIQTNDAGSNSPRGQTPSPGQQSPSVQNNGTGSNAPSDQISTPSQQSSPVQNNQTSFNTSYRQLILGQWTSEQSVGMPSASPGSSPPRYVPLGLINGIYNITCSAISADQAN